MNKAERETRELVVERDEERCVRCGVVRPSVSSLQHRRARGMGGSRSLVTSSPANFVLLCGSGTTGCHGWVESHPQLARVSGWRVDQHEDPRKVPVIRFGRFFFLDDEGGCRAAKRQ